MKLPWQKTTWEASIRANTALAIANVVLVLIAGYAVVQGFTGKNSIEVTLTPAVVDEKMVVGLQSANEAYIKSFGLYVSMLVANITVGNAQFVADSLSQFFESSAYPEIRKTILSAAETRAFKEAAAATKFEPSTTFYEPSTHKVFVTGNLTVVTSLGSQPPRVITYEMVVRIRERRPVVYSLESYDGVTPHTEQWLTDHPQQKEEK